MCDRKGPYMRCTVSARGFSQSSQWSSSNFRLIDDGPLWSFLRMIIECFRLFLRLYYLSLSGNRLCGIPGSVLAGSVSSSSTLQVFRNTIHFDVCFACLELYLISQFPLPRQVHDSASIRLLESGCHDHNKIAPCGMIKVLLIELNWIERWHLYVSLIFLFHVILRVTNSLCPWGWWCV